MGLNILMTGATGLVGRRLGKELVRRGHQLFVISRNREKASLDLNFPAYIIEGDLSRETLRDDQMKNIDAVIHLAGENISAGRWTVSRKQRLYNSRVKSLQNLLTTLQENSRLKVLISASAVGFYGDRGEEVLTEASARGQGFLSQLCQDWEQPLVVAERQKTWKDLRTVVLRLGVVIASEGGALQKMIEPFRAGVGAPIGTGKQWMSWIHIEDLVSLFVQSLENSEMSGVYNAVSPEPVTNQIFSQALADQFRPTKRLMPKVPTTVIKAMLGEMSQIVTSSQRVVSERISHTPFVYQYPDIISALREACATYVDGDSLFISEQYFPFPIEKVFAFFSDAMNLEKITPPSLKFHIESISTPEIREGTRMFAGLRSLSNGIRTKNLPTIKKRDPTANGIIGILSPAWVKEL
jgi:uncharacterized protein (TIGR01777 family)